MRDATANKFTLVPKAGVLDVEDPPLITPVEFIHQVITNINAQLGPIDNEIAKARFGDVAHVISYILFIFIILS
jgi:phosphatidylethanolamine-binding protein (PEBP) family uncharacterized protein